MSQEEVSKYVKMIENKKMKDLKKEIDKINNEEENPKVQKPLAIALQQCLVKKQTTPLGFAYALYVYKEIFVRGLFYYLEGGELDSKIHKLIFDTCLYGAEKDQEKRGQKYMSEIMNVKNQQSIILGNTAISLCLEIVQTGAKWYPIDLLSQQPNTQSRFARYYQKLKQKNVIFPDFQDHKYIQSSVKKDFDKTVEALKQILATQEKEQVQEAPQKEKPKETKQKSGQFIKIDGSLIQTKQINQNQLLKPTTNNETNSKLKQTNSQIEPQQVKYVLNNEKQSQKNQQLKVNVPNVISPSKNQEVKFILGSVLESQNNQEPKFILDPLPQQQQAKFILDDPKINIINEQAGMFILSESPNKNLKNDNIPSSLGIQSNTKDIESAIKGVQVAKESNRSIKPKQQKVIYIIKESEKKQKIEKIEEPQKKPVSIQKTNPKNYKRTQNSAIQNLNNITNNNLTKLQVPNSKISTPSKKTMNRTENFFSTSKSKFQTQNNRRSQPKTQKTFHQTDASYYKPIFSPTKVTNQPLFNRTLSNIRKHKNEARFTPYPTNINTDSILTRIEQSRINTQTIPFIPEYFSPVNFSMEALMLESLKVSKSKYETTIPFYINQLIILRLIKQQTSYLFCVENISSQCMFLGTSSYLQQECGDKFSKLIRLHSNKFDYRQIRQQKLFPNQMLQFAFDFYTTDPNFKFLEFTLLINGQIKTFHLPVTLLDQGYIDKDINHMVLADYNQVLKTDPFYVDTSKERWENKISEIFNTRTNDSRVLGQMSFVIQSEISGSQKISFFIKKLNSSQNINKIEIHGIYNSNKKQSQNYVKVLLQLLSFLLHQPK